LLVEKGAINVEQSENYEASDEPVVGVEGLSEGLAYAVSHTSNQVLEYSQEK